VGAGWAISAYPGAHNVSPMVAGTPDVAAQLLASFLSEELGATAPLLSLLCTFLGEGVCGSMGKQVSQGMRAGSADGVIEAAVLALASWGMIASSVLIALIVYCICGQCCTEHADVSYPGGRQERSGILRHSTPADGDEPVVRPASPAALAMVDTFSATDSELEVSSIGRTAGGGSEESAPACAVCVEDIDVGQRVSRLACGHIFHARCLLTWLQRADSCPNCRLRLEEGYKPSHHG
jgi:hypothetical protein